MGCGKRHGVESGLQEPPAWSTGSTLPLDGAKLPVLPARQLSRAPGYMAQSLSVLPEPGSLPVR